MEHEDIGQQPNKRPISSIPRSCTPRPDDSFFCNFNIALNDWLRRDIFDYEEEEEVNK